MTTGMAWEPKLWGWRELLVPVQLSSIRIIIVGELLSCVWWWCFRMLGSDASWENDNEPPEWVSFHYFCYQPVRSLFE